MFSKKRIAIVGIGPRGNFAFENLIIELCKKNALSNVRITLFEQSAFIGCGPIYRKEQPHANWMNVSHRFLKLEGRMRIESIETNISIEAFPSYHEWLELKNTNVDDTLDVYPRRSFVGQYLQERFQSLFSPLQHKGIVKLVNSSVQKVQLSGEQVAVSTSDHWDQKYDEVLLTIGHQHTELDPQLQDWKDFFAKNNMTAEVRLFEQPYPLRQFIEGYPINEKTSIALRGFGLSTLDIIRAFGSKIGLFDIADGEMQKMTFNSTVGYQNLFIPFTLDGLPPVPKPLNKIIDDAFLPCTSQLEKIEIDLSNKAAQKKAKGADFFIKIVAPLFADVYVNLEQNNNTENLSQNEVERIITNLLKNEDYTHPIISSNRNVLTLMEESVQMASGKSVFSLDYCLGQAWRHCHDTIYKALSHNELPTQVFAEIIALDERMKRYSFGPPVASVQMLLELAKRGVLNLSYINNPDITLSENGWNLKVSDKTIGAQLMINSVLDPPKILDTKTPIIKQLLQDKLAQAVHDDLGIETNEQSYVISESENKVLPIAVLGRLAKGSVMGVDAILECFGEQPKAWARQVVSNMGNEFSKDGLTKKTG